MEGAGWGGEEECERSVEEKDKRKCTMTAED